MVEELPTRLNFRVQDSYILLDIKESAIAEQSVTNDQNL